MSVAEPKSMIHPTRSSSLNPGRPNLDAPYSQPTQSGQVVFENGQYQDRSAPNQESTMPAAKNGLQELAGTRAQLLAVQRRLLEHVGKSSGWVIGWAAVLSALNQDEQLTNVGLEEDEEAGSQQEVVEIKKDVQLATPVVEILPNALRNAILSVESFRQFYEVRK